MNDKKSFMRIKWLAIILETLGFVILILVILGHMNVIDLPLISIDPYNAHSQQEIEASCRYTIYINLLGYVLLLSSIFIRIYVFRANKSNKVCYKAEVRSSWSYILFRTLTAVCLVAVIGLPLLITLFSAIDTSGIPL